MPDLSTHPWDDDKFHEECGVFGVWNATDAAALTALGLHALQHRGQEAAGIVSLDEGGIFHSHKGQGLVGDSFSDAKVMGQLRGRAALGHNRYATTGETALRNVQPLYADFAFGGLAVAHNGNLDRKSTRLNSSHANIFTLSLHDALPISRAASSTRTRGRGWSATASPTPR